MQAAAAMVDSPPTSLVTHPALLVVAEGAQVTMALMAEPATEASLAGEVSGHSR